MDYIETENIQEIQKDKKDGKLLQMTQQFVIICVSFSLSFFSFVVGV